MLNFLLILYVVGFFLNILFACIILFKSRDNQLRYYIVTCAISAAIWCASWFYFFTFRSTAALLSTYIAGLLPSIYFVVSLRLYGVRRLPLKIVLAIVLLLQFLFFLFPKTYIVKDVISFYPPIFVAGSVMVKLYRIYWGALAVFAILFNILTLMKVRGKQKQMIVHFSLGALIFTLVSLVFTIVFPVMLNNPGYTNIPPIFSTVWIALMTYGIMRHQFMDIELVIKRGSYFILLFALFIFPYILIINYISSKFVFATGIYNLLISAILWSTFFLFAERIKTFLSRITDRIFFKADYNADEVLSDISNKLQVITDLKLLLNTLNDDLIQQLKVSNVGMFMANKTGGSYVFINVDNMDVLINKQFDKKHIKDMVHLKKDHYIIQYLAKSEKNIISYSEIKEKYSQNKNQDEINMLMFMDNINSKLLVASVYNERVSGIISVGEKKSGDSFRDKDINLLLNLVKQGTLVISKIMEIEEKATIRAEKELHQSHRKEVEGKNHQLKDAMFKLALTQEKLIEEEQMSAMGKLAGEVAHDMRNPLSSMNRLLRYLLDEGYVGDSEKVLVDVYKKIQQSEVLDDKDQVLKYLKFLLSNNLEIKETLLEIVNINSILRKIANDFLEYSKVSQDISSEKIVIKNCVLEKIRDYDKECIDTKVTIKSEIHSDKKVALFDHQILKIFGNLLDNAIKAVQEKEGDDNKVVSVSLDNMTEDDKEVVILKIEDTGIGMSQEHLINIFKPFYTKRKNLQGTGLGLSIVKKIVESAGGIVTVSSTEGVGTIFKLIIPCYD